MENLYAVTLKSEVNGQPAKQLERIFLNHKKDLTPDEAGEIIQLNTNSAMQGSSKKYKIIVTELKKIK